MGKQVKNMFDHQTWFLFEIDFALKIYKSKKNTVKVERIIKIQNITLFIKYA